MVASQYSGDANPRSMFVEGPFGSGKTSFAIETLRAWLDAGVPPEKILILVPQRTLARPYLLALRDAERGPGGEVAIRTLNGLAQDMINLYWPEVGREAGFHDPGLEPRYLTIETAQYAMFGFVKEAVERGEFDAVSVSPEDIARQVIDNLAKAAIMGVSYKQIPELLSLSWGDARPRKRVLAYEAAGRVAEAYRAYCLENRLLDYSLQIDLFTRLMSKPAIRRRLFSGRTHLIAEHMEEDSPLTHDLLRGWLPSLTGALITYEWDAGYRIFVGADPEGGYTLRDSCDAVVSLSGSHLINREIATLENEVALIFNDRRESPLPEPVSKSAGFGYAYHDYFPEMLDWVADQIAHLVHEQGVPAREIAVLAPYLSDALRFSLEYKLRKHRINLASHRPSRSLRDEPAARTLLTLTALTHPHWGYRPPVQDVADALHKSIHGLDPIRAGLLARVVYRPNSEPPLSTFAEISNVDLQNRITYEAGRRYDILRNWLMENYPSRATADGDPLALDHFFQYLFDEVLGRKDFGFHKNNDPDAGRVTAELVESAAKFRSTLVAGSTDPDVVGEEYYAVVENGLLAALYVGSWRDELADAVFIAPAYTYLMRNRPVEVQFWLDVGSNGWWERLDQPLTHPYVLSRNWQPGDTWTDDHENLHQRDRLRRLMLGLVRRCKRQVYLGISDLGEQGFEQRGPMLNVFQQVLRRYPDGN